MLDGEPLENVEENRRRVIEAGGLYVIGSERLDSRRLDLQLAGRAGRQGDPGATRFYISLEDQLLQNFGGDTLQMLYKTLGIADDDGIEHPMVDKAILNAQRKKQSLYTDARKNGLLQDSVIASPRQVIYSLRNQTLSLSDEESLHVINKQVNEAIDRILDVYCDSFLEHPESWNTGLLKSKLGQWGLSLDWFDRLYNELVVGYTTVGQFIIELKEWVAFDLSARANQLIGADPGSIRVCQLSAIDHLWRGFLDDAEHIRTGIHLRAYAQVKPNLALKTEVFALFQQMYLELPVAMLDFVYAAIGQIENTLDLQVA
jgi:preprotein translocase subunit SecA